MKKRGKKKKKKRRLGKFAVTDTYPPCVHLHFKDEHIKRECLTHEQYLEFLATPKGYRWAGEVDCSNPKLDINKRKRKPKKRRIIVIRPEAGDVPEEEFETIWDVATPEVIKQLMDFLVNEFGMTHDEAEDFIDSVTAAIKPTPSQMKCQCLSKPKRKKRKKLKYNWLKDYAYEIAEKIQKYINSILTMKRTPKVEKIRDVILERIRDLIDENISETKPKKKLHKALVHIADRLALWINDIIRGIDKPKRKEPAIEWEESETEEEEEEEEEEPPKKKKKKDKKEKKDKKQKEEEEEEGEEEEEEEEEEEKRKPSKEKDKKKPSKEEESKEETLKDEEKEETPKDDEKKRSKEDESKKEPEKEEEKEETPKEEPEKKDSKEEEPKKDSIKDEDEQKKSKEDDKEIAPPIEDEEGEEEEEEEMEEIEGEEVEGEEEEGEIEAEIEEGEEEGEIEKVEEEEREEEVKPEKPLRDYIPKWGPPAWEVRPQTTSKIHVQKWSYDKVFQETAKARGVENPPTLRKIPVSESPLNLKSAEDWADWATKIADMAEEWGSWLDSKLTDAEKQLLEKQKSRSSWKAWKEQAQTEAQKWRLEEEKIRIEGRLWDKKLDETEKETEIKNLDLTEN